MLGSDSWVSKAQAFSLRVACPATYLRYRESSVVLSGSVCGRQCLCVFFWVPTTLNPVNPPSRLSSFSSRKHALRASHERYTAWRGLGFCYPNLKTITRFPWSS